MLVAKDTKNTEYRRKNMTNKKKSIATLAAVVLAIVLAVPGAAAEAPAIRVSSYKGSTLEV